MLTFKQVYLARKMLCHGETMQAVLAAIPNTTAEEIHDRIKKLRASVNKARPKYLGMGWQTNHHPPPVIPPQVLRERDLRLSYAPRDLTAWLMNDPLPGQSALERHSSPSIVHDPLDGLIYQRVSVL